MGNKLESLKQNKGRVFGPKSTQFKSGAVDVTDISRMAVHTINEMTESEEVTSVYNTVVPAQEQKVGRLSKTTLVHFLNLSKAEGETLFKQLREKHRGYKQKSLIKQGIKNSQYENMQPTEQKMQNERILVNLKEIETSLNKLSTKIIEANNISYDIFEKSLLEFSSDPWISQQVAELNSYTAEDYALMQVEQLYEVMQWRTNKIQIYQHLVNVDNLEVKKKIMVGLLAEESWEHFGLEEETIQWQYKNMEVSRSSPYIAKFSQLQSRFNAACESIEIQPSSLDN